MDSRMDQTDSRMARLALGQQPSSAAKSYSTSFKEYLDSSKPLEKPDFKFEKNKKCWGAFQGMLQRFKVCRDTQFFFFAFCLDCFLFFPNRRRKRKHKKPALRLNFKSSFFSN